MTFSQAAVHELRHTSAQAVAVDPARVAELLVLPVPAADPPRRGQGEFLAFDGMMSGHELAGLLESRAQGDYVSLARLIAANCLLAVRWNDELWIPMFQFDLRDFSLRPGVGEVLAELASVFDAEELAMWFITSSAWLDNRCPADVIATDPQAVVGVSRADRYIARG